jgi:hypothetical protein
MMSGCTGECASTCGDEGAATPTRGATEGDGESEWLWDVLPVRDPSRKSFFIFPNRLDILAVLVLSSGISVWAGDNKRLFEKSEEEGLPLTTASHSHEAEVFLE